MGRGSPKLTPTHLHEPVAFPVRLPAGLAPWHQSQTEAPAVEEWEVIHGHLKWAEGWQKASADLHRSEAPMFAPEAGSAVCGAI